MKRPFVEFPRIAGKTDHPARYAPPDERAHVAGRARIRALRRSAATAWRRSSPRCASGRRSSPGRRREGARTAPLARQAARAGAGRPAARPGQRVPRARRPGRMGHVRGTGPVGGNRHRYRRRRGPGVRDRGQRRDGQGRHVLPAHGQEAPARARGRRAERASVHLPRRLGRRVPPAPGRGLPRPRPLRADLLQPGADVGEGDPADRRGHGLVHGRRRLRARDERRDDHRQGHGHDLHRRPAAREGGDRART